MLTKEVEVEDKEGNFVPAMLVVCPTCKHDKFLLFVLDTGHNHLQCAQCNTSYCQGGCNQN